MSCAARGEHASAAQRGSRFGQVTSTAATPCLAQPSCILMLLFFSLFSLFRLNSPIAIEEATCSLAYVQSQSQHATVHGA
jgi:hypothetical protein